MDSSRSSRDLNATAFSFDADGLLIGSHLVQFIDGRVLRANYFCDPATNGRPEFEALWLLQESNSGARTVRIVEGRAAHLDYAKGDIRAAERPAVAVLGVSRRISAIVREFAAGSAA